MAHPLVQDHPVHAAAASTQIGPARPQRRGLPDLPPGTVARRQLEDRLTTAREATLIVVTAPSGAGKTLGVLGWASRTTDHDVVIWLDGGASRDPHTFWARLRTSVLEVTSGLLPTVPPTSGLDAEWQSWLAAFAAALDDASRRFVVVLDDFPVGHGTRLSRHLATLVTRMTSRLSLVVTCPGPSALDLRTALAASGATGGYVHIGPDALELDDDEIAEMLAARDIRPQPALVSAISERTFRWAYGVELAARILRATSGPEALDQLEDEIDAVLEHEVLADLPSAVREVVIRLSVAPDVTPGLARAVLGADVPVPWEALGCPRGFLEARPDGSFRCHPLLRRSARRRLEDGWPILARQTRRSAAEWFVVTGSRSVGLELAADVADGEWLGRALVRSLAVPTIAIDAMDEVLGQAVRSPAVRAAEPLIESAEALTRGDVRTAEAALARTGTARPLGEGREADLIRRLSEVVIRMAISRHGADHAACLSWVAESRRLWAQLQAKQVMAPETSWVLDAHEAAGELGTGNVDGAAAVLEPAPDLSTLTGAEQIAAAECVGLLAWSQALRGHLTAAARHAAEVLTTRPADREEVGVGYAQLAAAWVHLERGELDQADQRLFHASHLGAHRREGDLAQARVLAEVRLATAAGDPDVALRRLAAARGHASSVRSPWLADRLTVAEAEAHWIAGDLKQALATLTPEPSHALLEARALAAAVRRDVGDRRGARALLSAVEGRVAAAPIATCVQVWGLQAQLAVDAGETDLGRLLAERALRSAHREEHRLALAPVTPWIVVFLNRSPELARRHRGFVASLPPHRDRFAPTIEGPPTLGVAAEPLTERERQVLERLAHMCTTEEIARDLFVTANTVKTHIKSLFGKLSVNRRADAVRRGRELGLC